MTKATSDYIDELEQQNYEYSKEMLKECFKNYYSEQDNARYNRRINAVSIAVIGLFVVAIGMLILI